MGTHLVWILAVSLWLGLIGYRAYDFTMFENQRRESAEKQAAAEAALEQKLAARQEIHAPSVDAGWEGHQIMEIETESIESTRIETSSRMKSDSQGSCSR